MRSDDTGYTVWYLPDSPDGLLSEPLSRFYSADDLPPYPLREDEIEDFILNETYERGEPLEIRPTNRNGRTTGLALWQNKSWGID